MRQYGPLIRRLKLWPAGAFSFAKLKRCRVMDVLRLVATSTPRDGTIRPRRGHHPRRGCYLPPSRDPLMLHNSCISGDYREGCHD